MRSRRWAVLFAAITLSVATSYAAFRLREGTGMFPRSTSIVTPFWAFEEGLYIDVETGESHNGIAVGWTGIVGNALLLFGLLEGLHWLRAGLGGPAGWSDRKRKRYVNPAPDGRRSKRPEPI